MTEPLKVFLGWDPSEVEAYHVAAHSIIRRCSKPVSVTPINLKNLGGIYTRPRNELQSTEFSFSRFLVPYLCGYRGMAVFADCDVLCRGDIAELFNQADLYNAVQVVQHDYEPTTDTKFLNQVQTKYEKKNWSSVMLFNCQHFDCQLLTPEVVNTASGLYLHQFKWTERVGELTPEWNYLVGEEPLPKDPPKLIHYTLGGPWFEEYKDCDFAEEWREESRFHP